MSIKLYRKYRYFKLKLMTEIVILYNTVILYFNMQTVLLFNSITFFISGNNYTTFHLKCFFESKNNPSYKQVQFSIKCR